MLPQDLRYALRALVRRPTFAAFAIVTLAIGIGASTALFSLADAALLRPPPFPAAGQIDELYLTSQASGHGVTRMRWSYGRYEMLRHLASSYSALAAYGPYEFNLSGSDAPERVAVAWIRGIRAEDRAAAPLSDEDERRRPGLHGR